MTNKHYLTQWYTRHFANTEAVVFIIFVLVTSLILYSLGSILLPLLIALVLAYLLEWPVAYLVELKLPRFFAVIAVFMLFIGVIVLIVLGVVPVLKVQLGSLLNALPDMFSEGKKLLDTLQREYPNYISDNQLVEIIDTLKAYGTGAGKYILSFSLASLSNILTVIFYLILVPILVFLLLKDKKELIKQASFFMPEASTLTYKILNEVHAGLANYIRGKFLEAFIVGLATYIVLLYFKMQYSALLSVIVGISVFFPYVGAIIATAPIATVGLFQMGFGAQFIQLMIIYSIVQVLDGYVLVPVVLSEALNMSSIIIILSIILFGGLFGFWGVVFAIPLAILIKAIIHLWPSLK
jgi:putative permease